MIERIIPFLLFVLNFKYKVCTFFYCKISGIKFDSTWIFIGRPYLLKPHFWIKDRNKAICIGKNFKAISKFSKNSIGASQPVLLNASYPNSKIIIGDNVGMTACTIKSMDLVRIGNNVLIGSGVLISDNDSHPLRACERDDITKILVKRIIIEDDVFIGARSIILKGVTLGKGSVIGAGSVVCHDVNPFTIVGGNPAKIISNKLNQE